MKRKRLAILSLLLPAFILLASAGNMFTPQDEKKAVADPFLAMYNADVTLMEAMEVSLNESKANNAEAGIGAHSMVLTQKTFEEQKESLMQLVAEGRADELESASGVSEELVEKTAKLREEIYQDRYIVKYHGGDARSIADDVLIGESSERLSGGMELITLNEKKNPAILAEELKLAGADKYIEYIQPDIMVYPEGLVLELLDGQVSYPEDDPDVDESAPEEPDEDDEKNTEEPFEEEVSEEAFEVELLSEVVVALIDTGIELSHPMMSDKLWVNPENGLHGYNFHDDNDELYDPSFPTQSAHGTHVAGVIAREGGENVRIMVLKAFGPEGAYTSNILDAVDYAVEYGADIINCSFGSKLYNPALEDVLGNTAALIVAAAGNGKSDIGVEPVYPAAMRLDNLVSVGSVNGDGGLSYFSNYSNTLLDITAPGRDIESAFPSGETGPMTGTSMSAAEVTGSAAYVLSADPELTAVELRQRLLDGADRLSNLTELVIDGRMLNVYDAIMGVKNKGVAGNYPEDDFNVLGYSPTSEESWDMFSGSAEIAQVASGVDFTLVLREDEAFGVGAETHTGSSEWEIETMGYQACGV